MRNNGGQCHKHWPRYFLFTRNNDSIWAGASASRLTLELKQHFHTKSEQDYDRWMRRMAPRKKLASTANILQICRWYYFILVHILSASTFDNIQIESHFYGEMKLKSFDFWMRRRDRDEPSAGIRQRQKQKQSPDWDCETRYGCQAVSPTVKIFLGWHIICNFGQTHGMGPGIRGAGSLAFWL